MRTIVCERTDGHGNIDTVRDRHPVAHRHPNHDADHHPEPEPDCHAHGDRDTDQLGDRDADHHPEPHRYPHQHTHHHADRDRVAEPDAEPNADPDALVVVTTKSGGAGSCVPSPPTGCAIILECFEDDRDCHHVCHGDAKLDRCGICEGDGMTCL
jgi:hypothetical protein